MDAVDQLTPEIRHLFLAKASRRRALVELSFPEKVAVVVRLQEMAAPILRARGRNVRPWALNSDGLMTGPERGGGGD